MPDLYEAGRKKLCTWAQSC